MSLYSKVLGLPLVYNYVRPMFVGGIDMSAVFAHASVRSEDTIFDVGCGTGVALEHLPPFKAYRGFDTDPGALEAARGRAEKRKARLAEPEQVAFEARELGAQDVELGQPNVVLLAGVLHHLSDEQCVGLLQVLRESSRLRQVLALDVTFLPGQLFNNVLSVLDRGQYPRHPGGYVTLGERAGFQVTLGKPQPAGPKSKVTYWLMTLSPHA
jgi:SAM-dependent methyltransferase